MCKKSIVHQGTGTQPGVRPNQEWNWQPFGFQDDTQSAEPHQSGSTLYFFKL